MREEESYPLGYILASGSNHDTIAALIVAALWVALLVFLAYRASRAG